MSRTNKGSYRPAVALAFVSLLICGVLFPLAVTGIGQAVFPYQANGSQAKLGGRTVGSFSIDNGFTLPVFFHGRNESNPLTMSASGVDPDITVQDAMNQVGRIHGATGIPVANLTGVILSHEQWTLWFTGDPYVNVLSLNLALISSYPSIYSNYA